MCRHTFLFLSPAWERCVVSLVMEVVMKMFIYGCPVVASFAAVVVVVVVVDVLDVLFSHFHIT